MKAVRGKKIYAEEQIWEGQQTCQKKECQAEENGMILFKHWKKKLIAILYTLKISSKNNGKIRMFQTKKNWDKSLPIFITHTKQMIKFFRQESDTRRKSRST